MKYFFALVLVIGLSACAEAPVQPESRGYSPETCSKNAGFEFGYNDGLAGKKFDANGFTHRCREDLREAAYQEYKGGYEKGKLEFEKNGKQTWERRQQEKKTSQQNLPVNSQPGVTPAPPAQNLKAYYCSVEAFSDTYQAFGPTEIEAKSQAKALCQVKYHAMHCSDVECQKNE